MTIVNFKFLIKFVSHYLAYEQLCRSDWKQNKRPKGPLSLTWVKRVKKMWYRNRLMDQTQQHFVPHASRSFLCIRFVAAAFRSEEVFWRRGPPRPIFAPPWISLWTDLAKQEAQRATYCAPEYNVPPFWQISQGGNVCLLIRQKNTNLVEDIEILLPVKFRWIPFSGFRGEVENVSANQRPGRPTCFSDRPEKHKHW